MAVRRRRPLVPPPYPRRNRYIPRSSGLSKQIAVFGIVTHFFREVCYNSMKFIRSGLGDLHHQLHRCDFCQAPVKLIKQFEKLQPFGKGNEKPVFADRNLTVRQSAVIGKNKNVLRCQLESEHGKLVTAIRFKLDGQEIPEVGRKISMVYYPDINEYNGIVSIQFRIEDWRYV